MKTVFSLADIKKAIEMSRELVDAKNDFDIESILGCTEVQTSDIRIKYSEQEIIESLN